MITILRRKGLGRGSTAGVAAYAAAHDIPLSVVRNDIGTASPDSSAIIRWGCTSNIPHGIPVFNKASAIHGVSDKRGFRLLLNEHGLCPETWGFLGAVPQDVDFPLILRPSFHSQGKHVILCHNDSQLHEAAKKFPEHYISRYIPKTHEFRVFMCQGRVVWVASKTHPDPSAVAWNVAQGAKFENVKWGQWIPEVIQNAYSSFILSGLDFGGVDVMWDGKKAYTLEINSAPSLTSPYRKECTAKALIFMASSIPGWKYNIYPFKHGWKGCIHPAISDQDSL